MFRISKCVGYLYKPTPALLLLWATPHTCQHTHAFSCRKIKKHAFPTESSTLSVTLLPTHILHTCSHVMSCTCRQDNHAHILHTHNKTSSPLIRRMILSDQLPYCAPLHIHSYMCSLRSRLVYFLSFF